MSLDDLQAQLRAAVDQQFAALKQQYEQSIQDARHQAAAEAQRVAEARIAQARVEMEAHVEQLVNHARAETEQRVREAAEIERNALEQEIRQDYEQQLGDRVAKAQAEGERRAREAAAIEFQAVEQRIHQQLDRDFQQQLEHVIASTKRSHELQREADQRRAESALAAERERANSEIEAERARAKNEIEAERARANSELEAERQRAAAELETERRRLGADVEAERQRATTELAALRAELQGEMQRLRGELESEKARISAMPPPAPPVSTEPLLRGMQQLDDSRTLSQALDALVAGAGSIAGRSALFIIDGDRLKAWKSIEIPDVDVRSVESSISGRDLLARAVQTAQAVHSTEDFAAPPFARMPADRPSMSVPVMIGGRAVAVLYVDRGQEDTATAASLFEMVETLTRHASSVVALRTAMRTLDVLRGVPADGAGNGDGASDDQAARRFARLLVSEIKLYNEAAVRAGRQQRDILQRLRTEIDRARRLYDERVPASVGSRHAYFQQELVQTLADGDPALLGN